VLSGFTNKIHIPLKIIRNKDWTENEKKQPMSIEKLQKTFREPKELLLKTTFKDYEKVTAARY